LVFFLLRHGLPRGFRVMPTSVARWVGE
jgi:hypothetical protein